jgi:hypothetical protein
MSASIAAAQRRRAGPPDTGRPGGGPKPSINSAHAFHGQGQGQAQRPNMPTGRLAGQHAAQQQAQDRQQYAANQKANNSLVDDTGNSKITVAQAITLITLRLGKLETAFYQIQMQLNEGGLPSSGEFGDNVKLVDNNVIESIIARLESLEKRGTVSSSNTDVSALKQQVDLIKPSVITLKNASLSNTKDIKELNSQITNLFEEMNVLKGELAGLQGVVNEFTNGQLEMEYSDDNNGDGQEYLDGSTSLDELDSSLLNVNVTNGKLDLTDLTM